MNTQSTAPRHHPSEATLMSYAVGGISAAHRLIVECHAAQCRSCHKTIRLLEEIGGVMLGELPPTPMRGAADLVDLAQPEPSITHERDLRWLRRAMADTAMKAARWLAPGVRHQTLLSELDGKLHMLRVEAGRELPHHGHRNLELTFVLEGSFHDGIAEYGPGDVAELEDTDVHCPVATGTAPCVCLIATTGRLSFTGWIARLLQPIMPF